MLFFPGVPAAFWSISLAVLLFVSPSLYTSVGDTINFGEEKEETADAENVDETNVEEANEVENVETSEENKDEE